MRDTQKSALPHVRSIVAERHSDALQVDAASRRNLELEASLGGNADASLAGVLDHCATTMGSRLLRRWLNRPLRDQALLRQRYQALDSLRGAPDDTLRDLLADIGDLERILSRIALGSARPAGPGPAAHGHRPGAGDRRRSSRPSTPRCSRRCARASAITPPPTRC